MGEITLDLRLVVRVPEKGLTINSLIAGLKDGIPRIYEAILTTLMKVTEERVVEMWVQRDAEQYRRNGSQSKARELKRSLGPIRYRLAQMLHRKTAKSFMPLVSALSIPAHDHYLELGRRWSDLGLLNWLEVVFYKVFKPDLGGLQWLGNRKRLPKIKLIALQTSFS